MKIIVIGILFTCPSFVIDIAFCIHRIREDIDDDYEHEQEHEHEHGGLLEGNDGM